MDNHKCLTSDPNPNLKRYNKTNKRSILASSLSKITNKYITKPIKNNISHIPEKKVEKS